MQRCLANTKLVFASALLAILAAGSMALATASAGADATVTCDKVASTTGSDSAAGTLDAPYRTSQKLADSLSAGQTGCLREGTYQATQVKVTHGGTSSAPLTMRSYPGERATLVGRLWITDSANFVTISYLNLDGSGAPACASGGTCTILSSPEVNGDDATFTEDDVTNHHHAICFHAGTGTYGRAVRLTITRNRIHDCGRLPATNYDHGIYLGRADYAEVTENLIYDNADRGIQFYPDAQHSHVAHNVIDGNGVGIRFAGASGVASNDNVVEHNIITNSRGNNIDSWYPSGNPVGTGNTVHDNCLWNGGRTNTSTSYGGYSLSSNLFQDPAYVDRAAKDFRLGSSSPCLSLAGDTAASLDGESSPAASVNQAPTAQLTAPTDGGTFTSQLAIKANATDDAAVSRVEFRVDGKLVDTDSAAPYGYTWKANRRTSYASHQVAATAYDAVGLSATSTVSATRVH